MRGCVARSSGIVSKPGKEGYVWWRVSSRSFGLEPFDVRVGATRGLSRPAGSSVKLARNGRVGAEAVSDDVDGIVDVED